MLPRVARTGTHLFHFLEFVEGFRGWGRGLRRAVGRWYTGKTDRRLAFQAVKYRQRDGWRHRDALRLAHPKAESETQEAIFRWMAQGWPDVAAGPHPDPAQAVQAYRRDSGVPAKLVVVAMTANRHSIGDPRDAGMLNVIGFDTATPQLIADFIR